MTTLPPSVGTKAFEMIVAGVEPVVV